eukprot:TRINITY_DN18384_c0_g1_i1.p1 TRINITY_DN18384_c0_g1~~TRINITY_DN18384_c0_g1_i1.p1  ORF type:complete len:727 (+),score=136.69 TRINITY_DN18384_c0_g1_i1:58-2181(+)
MNDYGSLDKNTHENLFNNFYDYGGIEQIEDPLQFTPTIGCIESDDPQLDQLNKALNLNREYQHFLKDQQRRIELALIQTINLSKHLRASSQEQQSRSARKLAAQTKKSDESFFVDKEGNRPPDNPDTESKMKKFYRLATFHITKQKKWTKEEDDKLLNGVRFQNKDYLTSQLVNTTVRAKSLNIITKEIEDITNIPDEKLRSDIVDWDALALKDLPHRSGIDCKIHWLGTASTNLNKEDWTKAEDKCLLKLAAKYKGRYWELIADELAMQLPNENGTRRNVVQCFRRYQRSLNTAMVKGKWTPEEDKLLLDTVKRFGDKNWQQIAKCMEGRTGQQCLHRWMKTIDPSIRRGRWSTQEDLRLLLGVHAYGNTKNWIKVQKHVTGRTDVQCRERFMNNLNPNLNHSSWTEEEDRRLLASTNQHGIGKWSLVAQDLAPRTDNQCWKRWKIINHEKFQEHCVNRQKRICGLVSYFVGREKDRPELGPEDFEMNITEINKTNNKPTTMPASKLRKIRNTTFSESSHVPGGPSVTKPKATQPHPSTLPNGPTPKKRGRPPKNKNQPQTQSPPLAHASTPAGATGRGLMSDVALNQLLNMPSLLDNLPPLPLPLSLGMNVNTNMNSNIGTGLPSLDLRPFTLGMGMGIPTGFGSLPLSMPLPLALPQLNIPHQVRGQVSTPVPDVQRSIDSPPFSPASLSPSPGGTPSTPCQSP